MAFNQKPKMKNCIQCGRVFIAYDRGEDLCADCKILFQELEARVVDYVKENPKTTITEVSEATGVSKKLIQRMAREGIFVDVPMGENFTYPCQSCGKPIKSGTYCTSCLTRLRQETQRVAEAMKIRFRDDVPTIERLNTKAQLEFEREQRDRRTFSKTMTKIIRPN